jgi:ABC-type bacteriocin/lantibiotic exporter with double-glycine peptidase domain
MLSFFNRKIPSVLQIDLMDSGPACIKIVGQFYGVHYDIGYLRNLCQVARQGVSIYHFSNAFEKPTGVFTGRLVVTDHFNYKDYDF